MGRVALTAQSVTGPFGDLRTQPEQLAAVAECGSRCQVLPIETVSRMQSGDFGVSMSELLPSGYITPGSFTDDGRYRVSELADDIRRNGVSRPLRIYMGRTRPVVHDGHHRYAAAVIAEATCLPIEITHPEDMRDVTDWGQVSEVSEASALPGGPR